MPTTPTATVTTVTDALGHTTTTTYDLDGEPTLVTRADGTTQGTGYDADGNVVSQTDGLGHATTYSYDPLNHLASMTDPLIADHDVQLRRGWATCSAPPCPTGR